MMTRTIQFPWDGRGHKALAPENGSHSTRANRFRSTLGSTNYPLVQLLYRTFGGTVQALPQRNEENNLFIALQTVILSEAI